MREQIKDLFKELKMKSALENFEFYLKEFKDREEFLLHILKVEPESSLFL